MLDDASVSRTFALTRNFYAWEARGRGWEWYPSPVRLEPPFMPFPGHFIVPGRVKDEARREHRLGSRIAAFFAKRPSPAERAVEEAFLEEPDPEIFWDTAPISEMRLALPPEVRITPSLAEGFLLSLSASSFPIAFEVVGDAAGVALQFAVRTPDKELVVQELRAFSPEVAILDPEPEFQERWERIEGGGAAALEFGLGREFMLPLRTFREFSPDPLTPVVGALSDIREKEVALLQVLFEPAVFPWADEILLAVTDGRGEPFFLDAPELTHHAREKVVHPLYAAVIRVAARSAHAGRAWEIVRRLAGALAHLGRPDGNELIPLAEDEEADLVDDLLGRRTHRTGMLLGSVELAALVHLPNESVRARRLLREMRRTKPPPALAQSPGTPLGVASHEGETHVAHLPRDLRMRHVHVVGASGTGKSTLLIQLILEDIGKGEGVAVVDPHGDLVDEILGRIPEERHRDVILFDPADEEVSLGWNMLEASSETEETLLASDLVGVFRRLSTSWGDQMNSVLANAILAFLESDQGGTLLELRRFLVDRDFRTTFLQSVRDSEVLYYWHREFPLLVGKPQGPILTRLDTFLRPKLVRRVVVEREHRIDFRGIVDGGGIFLAKLAQGAIGEENAVLLGSLLVSKFHQVAISRADLAPSARRHFFLYLDECHEFATPSMAALLTGARKYRLGLTAAHQGLRQLEARHGEVRAALLGNAATRIVFRVGEEDARELARGFSFFTEEDLGNLGVGEAIVRMERAEYDFNLRTRDLPPQDPETARAGRERILALTRERFPRHKENRKAEVSPLQMPERREPVEEAPPPHTAPAPAMPASPPPKRATRPQEPVPPLGRGGPEHQYLQDLVKRWAESHGYRAVIEEEILGGRGSVDVALRTDDFSIACEISVTSTVGQEVGNVLKCLEAGFHEVAILALKRPRLTKIEAALKTKLAPPELARVHFLSPEELFTMLAMRPVTRETVVDGYKVKVRRVEIDPKEAAARYKALTEVVAKSVRRMTGGEKP